MFRFNAIVTATPPATDEQIIRTFYTCVQAWQKENPTENVIKNTHDINGLWKYYV